ncbi:MAG: bacillithiol biosynthesis BshC, partial [Deinococcus sp.]|nr:bacillithiol biosynthesis BshC [Deinococcus sp.]
MARPGLHGLSVAAAYRQGALHDFFARAQPQGTPREWLHAWAREQGSGSVHLSAEQRAALVAALREYHAHLGLLTPATAAALDRLAHPAARVVVAGQQAGLLTGPAYAVHTAADAALLARELSDEDAPVVGVFWIASQDHDAEEVAWVSLLDLEEQLRREVVDLPAGGPVGRVPWRADWTASLRALLGSFVAPEPHRQAVL